jgi:hypothetical protein
MAGRRLHLTFHKCGSQWVRDVLAAPEVVASSGYPLHRSSADLHLEPWPDQPDGTFVGPVYNAARHDWEAVAGAADRALVVLRDPRDRAVSMAQSAAFSHVPTAHTRLTRSMVLALPQSLRLRQALADLMHCAGALRSWVDPCRRDARVLVLTYEGLIADSAAAFSAVFDHFAWPVPTAAMQSAVARLSFRARSGRSPGQVDESSHYRRGVAGDWRAYFDQDLGSDMEAAYPGLLVDMGYERDPDWWRGLPRVAAPLPVPETPADPVMWYEQRAELTATREKVLQLQAECEARGRCIAELDQAARERLDLINRLQAALDERAGEAAQRDEALALRQRVRELEAECAARGRCIGELDAEARRRLALVESLTHAGTADRQARTPG